MNPSTGFISAGSKSGAFTFLVSVFFDPRGIEKRRYRPGTVCRLPDGFPAACGFVH
jgi:hypothetical protein